jgi:hypothetical protein
MPCWPLWRCRAFGAGRTARRWRRSLQERRLCDGAEIVVSTGGKRQRAGANDASELGKLCFYQCSSIDCRAQKPGELPSLSDGWDTPTAVTVAGGVGDTMDDVGDRGAPSNRRRCWWRRTYVCDSNLSSSSVDSHGRGCFMPIGNSGSRRGDGIPAGETCCSLSSPRRS